MRQLIEEGFGGPSKINSRPAKHLSTLISQMVISWEPCKTSGQVLKLSLASILISPFVREDKMTFEEVKQQIQSFVFSINTPSRWEVRPLPTLPLIGSFQRTCEIAMSSLAESLRQQPTRTIRRNGHCKPRVH